jgi:carbonic anhydrase
MDFRLTSAINKWMEEKNIMDDCDVISIAGISKAIAENPESEDAKYILSQIKLSHDLHESKKLYLVHHTDCGAYGGHDAFENLEIEKQTYSDHMIKAKEIINNLVPDMEVIFVLADMTEQGIDFKEL